MSISAFGIDHGISKSQTGVYKGYTQVAAKLERAAAAGHPYAQARVAAGKQGQAVGRNLARAKEANQARSKTLNPVARAKHTRVARTTTAAAGQSMKAGRQGKKLARKQVPKGVTPGGLARMESSAAQRIAANQRPGWKKTLAIGGGAGLAGGGGAFAAQQYGSKKRSA